MYNSLSVDEIRKAKEELEDALEHSNAIELLANFTKKTGIQSYALNPIWLNITTIQDRRPVYRLNGIEVVIEPLII
jgi:hypothetical protein